MDDFSHSVQATHIAMSTARIDNTDPLLASNTYSIYPQASNTYPAHHLENAGPLQASNASSNQSQVQKWPTLVIQAKPGYVAPGEYCIVPVRFRCTTNFKSPVDEGRMIAMRIPMLFANYMNDRRINDSVTKLQDMVALLTSAIFPGSELDSSYNSSYDLPVPIRRELESLLYHGIQPYANHTFGTIRTSDTWFGIMRLLGISLQTKSDDRKSRVLGWHRSGYILMDLGMGSGLGFANVNEFWLSEHTKMAAEVDLKVETGVADF